MSEEKQPPNTKIDKVAFARDWRSLLAVPPICLALSLVLSGLCPSLPVGLLAPWLGVLPESPVDRSIQKEFRWSDLAPTTSLEYVPCFGAYQCARLSVPLNWNASAEERDNGPRAAVAVIKLPAKVPVTDARYGGPIVLNPGGPGESGVFQVLSDGRHLQTILDSPALPGQAVGERARDDKYFDILSFDPRGVNNTTPALACFPDAFNRQTWLLRFLDVGLLWDSESAVGLEWARASALGASCSAGQRGEDAILPYVNTAQIVEDMVDIIEKEGERRADEAEKALISAKITGEQFTHRAEQEIRQRTAYHRGQEKIQFWGMSYGTTIGSTFAAMHPEKVYRMVLDGNMDPADHYKGLFEHSLQDADKAVTKHSEYCFEAGPEKCPLYNSTSPEAIEARFTSIMSSLKADPIPVPLSNSLGPEVVTYGDIHLNLLGGLYLPFALTEQFWDILRTIEVRNITHPKLVGLAKRKQATMTPATYPGSEPGCDRAAGAGDINSCLSYHAWAGAFLTISCMDAGGGPSNLTREAFSAYRAKLAAQSRWVSPTWTRNRLVCEGIDTRPAWRPDLTFEKQEWDNTSHPLLIIGNSHDPATPLANAHRVSRELFPGSVVLQQDSEGHCSHATPSLCTAQVLRRYFQTGELPEPGTVCQPEKKPFVGCVRDGGCHFEGDEVRVWEALVELADTYGFSKKHDEDDEQAYRDTWDAYRHFIGA